MHEVILICGVSAFHKLFREVRARQCPALGVSYRSSFMQDSAAKSFLKAIELTSGQSQFEPLLMEAPSGSSSAVHY